MSMSKRSTRLQRHYSILNDWKDVRKEIASERNWLAIEERESVSRKAKLRIAE
jgi:hypothetical protein